MSMKKSCLNESNSKKTNLGTNKLSILPGISSKHESNGLSNGDCKKPTYLENFTEQDIQNDKTDKRCKLLMNKLNELTLNKNDKKLKTKQLQPLKTTPRPSSSSSVKSNSSIKNDSKINNINPATSFNPNKSDKESDDESANKEIKAPNELLEEFLVYIMKKQWEDAKKLCNFILMYEPNNKTAREFLPLIESKLNEDDSDSSDSSDESSNDEDNSDENDSDESDESDENSEEEASESKKYVDKKNTKNNPLDDHDDDDDVQTPRKSIKKILK